MSSNSVCNHTRNKQIESPAARFCYYEYDYRPNWTPLSPITITYNIMRLKFPKFKEWILNVPEAETVLDDSLLRDCWRYVKYNKIHLRKKIRLTLLSLIYDLISQANISASNRQQTKNTSV